MITDFKNDYFEELNKVVQSIDKEEIFKAYELLLSIFKNDKSVYTCGNGGSASTASHIVNDFSLMFGKNFMPRFKIHSLCDNISSIMAISNDVDYEDCFVNQLIGVLNKGDLVIAISGSGNSKNVIKTLEYATWINAHSLALVGYDGGIIKKENKATCTIHVPIKDMQKTEDIHMALFHMFIQYFQKNKHDIFSKFAKGLIL
jgi:D-sedoheptulose 7-phosphate isomerase